MVLLLLLLFSFVVGSKTWVVQLEKHVAPEAFAQEHHLELTRALAFMGNGFYEMQETSRTRNAFSLRGGEDDGVHWAERQVERRQYKRIPDPLYENQWHLHTHPFGVDADFVDSNVTGAGIVIGLVDDGLQHLHPELRDAYDALNSYNYNSGPHDDPSPRSSRDGHGTAAAGVAAASANNGHCGRGVAPGAKIAGIRLIAEPVYDATEAEALTHNGRGGIDIYSCSWGPQDDGVTFGEAGYLVRTALARFVGAKVGRSGKGSIYVWASGNGRESGDSCAFDAYANSPYVFPVGAIDHTGHQAWYSEGCANLVGVAPSSGANLGIITSDLLGPSGYAAGECTSTFGGTSSAAPLAAGIFARLLQERPDLTWRDLMHVIARGATLIQPTDESWVMNSARIRHSNRFGFGLLKLPPLLAAARAHELVPATQKLVILPDQIFPSGTGSLPFNCTFLVQHHHNVSVVEQVMVKMNAQHKDRGRLIVTLTSPSGTASQLAPPRPQDHGTNWPYDGWTLGSRAFLGETQVNGKWIFSATDSEGAELKDGGVSRVQFTLFGY